MDFARYQRQVRLPGIGEEGQRRLAGSVAVVVGVGALGCTSADLLVRAGVGTVVLIDRDVVELTNLQRQSLFTEADAAAGLPKAEAGAARLGAVNSGVRVVPVVADLGPSNVERLIARGGAPSVILDGTDNFETRYLLNDVGVKGAIPYCYAGVVGTCGMAAAFLPGMGCLRCVFEDPPAPGAAPTCDTAGVLGGVVAMAAGAQATDAIRILVGGDSGPAQGLLDFDLWSGRVRRVRFEKRADCPCCGRGRYAFLNAPRGEDGAVVLCGQRAVQVSGMTGDTGPVDLAMLETRLSACATVRRAGSLLRAVFRPGETPEPIELVVFADGRAIVRGTDQPARARSIYARYIGA